MYEGAVHTCTTGQQEMTLGGGTNIHKGTAERNIHEGVAEIRTRGRQKLERMDGKNIYKEPVKICTKRRYIYVRGGSKK